MTVSIIIPIYNVQDYLTECVQSVLAQTYTDYEIILIDDGSTDQSGIIAEQLTVKDPRIHVYHKENGGLSDARNYGIDRAKGEYVTFIDSDDYIAPNCLDILCALIRKYDADVSCISCNETTTRIIDKQEITENTGVCSGIEAIENSLLRRKIGVSACGKLFSTKLFSNIRFPKGELYEDFLTIPYIFEKCQRVAFLEVGLYYYFQRPGSITNSRITEKHMRYFDNAISFMRYFDQYGKTLHDAAVVRVVGESINRFAEILLFCPDYYEKIEVVRKKMMIYWKEAPENPLVPKTTKIQVAVLMKSAALYRFLFKPYKWLKSMKNKKQLQ